MNFSINNNTMTHSSFPEQINSNETKENNNELDLFNLTDKFNKKDNSDNLKYGFSKVNDNIVSHHEPIGIGINTDLNFDLSNISKEVKENNNNDSIMLEMQQKIIIYDNKLDCKVKIHNNYVKTSMKFENPNKVTIVGYENELKINKDKCELI